VNVLLFSMPDSFEHTAPVAICIPNAALTSLAGNVDAHHRVAVADLVLVQDAVSSTVERLLREVAPEVVGLSVKTFQRRTAQRVVALVRALRPDATIVVGGYDPSLAPEVWEDTIAGPDIIVFGEGDITFRELIRAIEQRTDLGAVTGVSYRTDRGFVRTPARSVSHLGDEIQPPNRAARALTGYTFLGRNIDIVETSRGCTYDCSFCSIIEMRGRNFHTWTIDRVVDDIRDAERRGARAIFIVDDNITLNVKRFRALCQAIVDARLSHIDYLVQGMTSAFAAGGDDLADVMRRAGFRYVFLGIENVVADDLAFLKATAKNADRQDGRVVGSATMRAIDILHRHGMFVVGGLTRTPTTPATVEANLDFADDTTAAHSASDAVPGTPMTRFS
jgi:radical SAM superfamily enzyme YgiQ (UPF0313 family)